MEALPCFVWAAEPDDSKDMTEVEPCEYLQECLFLVSMLTLHFLPFSCKSQISFEVVVRVYRIPRR